MPSCVALIGSIGCAARTAAKASSCPRHPSRPRRCACCICEDRREIPAALAIHVLGAWRCRSPGARSAVWPGSCDTRVRSRLFATGLVRGACFHAPHRAPSASCQTIASRSRRLTIPITTAPTAVQSNEVYPPPSPPRQDSTFVGRRINAIRCAGMRLPG